LEISPKSPDPYAERCPICQRAVKVKKTRRLFGIPVCRKCSNAFANRRQVAYIVDLILLIVASFLVGSGFAVAFPELTSPTYVASNTEITFWLIFNWIVVPIVFGMKDGFAGQSPGKWLTGVQAVDKDSRAPVRFLQALKRNLVLVVPIMPLVAALQLIKGVRSGDTWANTAVIWKKHRHKMPFDPRGILCTSCGYDLTGNVSGRCPECGKEIPVKAPPLAAPLVVPVVRGMGASR